MRRNVVWYGSTSTNLFFFPAAISLGADRMTVIAVAFDPTASKFVIAADGRAASDSMPMLIQSDTQQKIFPTQNEHMAIVYALTGFASSDDGSFEMIAEANRQIRILAERPFVDGYEFAAKFCFNMTRVVEKAISTGRIDQIPTSQELPPQERGRMFIFFLLGHFKGLPFWKIATFYHDEKTRRVRVRPQDLDLSRFQFAGAGSDRIANMVCGNLPIDPKIAAYRHIPSNESDALEATTNYVKACSDPIAIEVDPWCRIVGGHIHAAELTKYGFKWLIPPAA